ncbi:MAG TPA: aspartate aminotransferase family protein, partial [Anaerolineae bacterium]|nr:aspartate aminotransferase family protein [Anaerolineae bacterium]
THGKGCTLYDTEGNAYLDCVAGIAVNALGYADPEIVSVMKSAADGLVHVSNLYHTAPHARLAQLLCETSFADRVHYANSGAEANEGAFKFARKWARQHGGEGKYYIVAFSGAFHGRLFGSLAATPRPHYQEPFRPLMPGVRFAQFNDLDSAAEVIEDDVAAVIVEPVQGEGGIHPATPAFLTGLRELCDQHHALLIFDEVQCGLGRTGHLWTYQGYGVEPDMLTAAKPLAGGLPMGAILMKQHVADVMEPGDHASTFAGGPFVSQVAEAVVRRIADDSFLAQVRGKGDYLLERLAKINSPHIREVRGRGLMVGIELDMDAKQVVSAGYKQGLITVNAGPNVLRLVPPLVITHEEIDEVVHRLGSILAEL